MRKNKGYQKDTVQISWKRKVKAVTHDKGKNISLEQYLGQIDKRFDVRVKDTIQSYKSISKKTTLVGGDLRKYCRKWMLWEVKFDDDNNIIPLDDVLKDLEIQRERCKARRAYSYVKRIVNKDNQKFVYNSGNGPDGYHGNTTRVPSLKRSKATWKRFYELFPKYKENYDRYNNNGVKLKKVW